jgi:hypothetical protein
VAGLELELYVPTPFTSSRGSISAKDLGEIK